LSLVPGFVDRPADPQRDLDAVAGILEASERRLYGDADSARPFLEYGWRTSWIDVPTMTRVVFDGDSIAAYAEVEAVDRTVSLHGWVCVHPDHAGRGLGAALLDWVERTAVATAPGGASVLLHHTIPAADRDATQIVRRRGLRHVNTSWHMRMPLDGSYDRGPAPDGVTIRPSRTGDDDVAIHDVLMRAFEGSFGWSFVPIERFWRDARADPKFDSQWVLVAELGGEVVGVSWQWDQSPVGWVGELGVRPELQGRGIGRALLRHALADLARRGFRTAQLNVDSHNEFGAVGLYRSVGMQVHREYRHLEKPIVGAGARAEAGSVGG
jgi:mycothiol synthase